jgi:hypothetical protein
VNEPSVNSIRVGIPSRADYLHVLRAVTGAVAARLRMPVDSIEDLRLAVHESANVLISLDSSTSRLTLEMRATDQELRAVVCAEASVRVWPPPGFEGSLAWKVISGLCDETMVKLVGNLPAIEMRKRTLDP